MNSSFLIKLTFSLALLTLTTLPASAQVDPTIQNLADGDYVYGEAPSINENGAGYLVFQKKGNAVTGLFYQEGTNLNFCFHGNVPANSHPEKPSSPTYFPSVGGLFPLEFQQLPQTAIANFQQCLK